MKLRSRGTICPSFAVCERPLKDEGAGNAGYIQCTRSFACKNGKHANKSTTGSPERSGIPCAMVLTVSFVVSPETGFVVSVGDNARALHRTSASGCQDAMTSPSAH